jgi:TatD DNase family protein
MVIYGDTMIFSDAHIHIAQIAGWEPVNGSPVCACAHSPAEFAETEAMAAHYPDAVYQSFGMHPQNPDLLFAPFLEDLLRHQRIAAIGETGFDLFTSYSAADVERQETAWHIQLTLAARYKVPVIVHCRKALDRIFRDSKELKKLPAVVFHSFMGSPEEALSLIRRGIRAYFSFGKPLLNNNKRAIRCVTELPLAVLLAETDAPWQRLKGEEATLPRDITRVYEEIAKLRGMPVETIGEVFSQNFMQIFCKKN